MGLDIRVKFVGRDGRCMKDENKGFGFEDYDFNMDRRFNREFKKEFMKLTEYHQECGCYASLETENVNAIIRIIDKVCNKKIRQAKYLKLQMKLNNRDWWYFKERGYHIRKDDIKYIWENIKYIQRLKKDILSYNPKTIAIQMDW